MPKRAGQEQFQGAGKQRPYYGYGRVPRVQNESNIWGDVR